MEWRFLISARRLVMLYISTKFCEIISNGIKSYRADTISIPKISKGNNSANKSAAGIAWCPATALTSSEVTVLNLCTSSSHALYCTKFWEIIWNDIKVIEWTWFLYWKFQREIILQKDTISILTIYKITKWHKTEKNCRRLYGSQSKSGHTLFVPSFVKWSQTVSKL